MFDFIKISLILFEITLSAIVLVRTSNKDVLKDADDKVFVLILIVITFLSVVRPAFFNEIQKPVIKLFLSAIVSVIATITIALIYGYILYQSKLDSVDFMIGLAIMIFVAVTDNYLIDYVIMRDSQDTAKHNDGCLKRKRIKI